MAINRQLRNEIADALTAHVEGRSTLEELETQWTRIREAYPGLAQDDLVAHEAMNFMHWSGDYETITEQKDIWLRYIAIMRTNLIRVTRPITVQSAQWHWLGLVFLLYAATVAWIIVDPVRGLIISLFAWLLPAFLMAKRVRQSTVVDAESESSVNVTPFETELQWQAHRHLIEGINCSPNWNDVTVPSTPARPSWREKLLMVLIVPVGLAIVLVIMSVLVAIGLVTFPIITAWSAFGRVQKYDGTVIEQPELIS